MTLLRRPEERPDCCRQSTKLEEAPRRQVPQVEGTQSGGCCAGGSRHPRGMGTNPHRDCRTDWAPGAGTPEFRTQRDPHCWHSDSGGQPVWLGWGREGQAAPGHPANASQPTRRGPSTEHRGAGSGRRGKKGVSTQSSHWGPGGSQCRSVQLPARRKWAGTQREAEHPVLRPNVSPP